MDFIIVTVFAITFLAMVGMMVPRRIIPSYVGGIIMFLLFGIEQYHYAHYFTYGEDEVSRVVTLVSFALLATGALVVVNIFNTLTEGDL